MSVLHLFGAILDFGDPYLFFLKISCVTFIPLTSLFQSSNFIGYNPLSMSGKVDNMYSVVLIFCLSIVVVSSVNIYKKVAKIHMYTI